MHPMWMDNVFSGECLQSFVSTMWSSGDGEYFKIPLPGQRFIADVGTKMFIIVLVKIIINKLHTHNLSYEWTEVDSNGQ